jgi:hypothetical protein
MSVYLRRGGRSLAWLGCRPGDKPRCQSAGDPGFKSRRPHCFSHSRRAIFSVSCPADLRATALIIPPAASASLCLPGLLVAGWGRLYNCGILCSLSRRRRLRDLGFSPVNTSTSFAAAWKTAVLNQTTLILMPTAFYRLTKLIDGKRKLSKIFYNPFP